MSMSHSTKVIACLAAVAPLALAAGCTNFSYYLQAMSGQLELWQRTRAIDEVVAEPGTALPLKEKLQRTLTMREYASKALSLPDNASYKRYADLGRRYVVWNVFAAPEFSLEPVQWCFPFAGCVGYRGYFSETEAEQFAQELTADRRDVYVGGVAAYSTLGWFADPILNTFAHYPDVLLARLIFHELAHQVVYVADDSVFNESFAVTVEREGLRRWLARNGSDTDRELFKLMSMRRDGFVRLIGTYRERLAALYKSELAPAPMRAQKQRIFAEMDVDYQRLKVQWGGFGGYDRWFAQKPNNAHFVSISIYTQMVPAFEALLQQNGGDLARFYDAVRQLAALPRDQRTTRLKALQENAPSIADGSRGAAAVSESGG
jgi:predicted aminopeptidase